MRKKSIKRYALILIAGIVVLTGITLIIGCEDTITAAITEEIKQAQAAGSSPSHGEIIINGGDSYTNNTSVNLALSAKDDIAVTEMRITENSDYSNNGWIPYQSSYTFNLSSTEGTKIVYVWFKDGAEQVSSRYSDTIILDTSSPSINSTSPGSDATGVARDVSIQVEFDQPIDAATLTGSNFYLKRGTFSVPVVISYSSGLNTATLTPVYDLNWDTVYTVSITTGVSDAADNSLVSGRNWNFRIKKKEASLSYKGDSISINEIIDGDTTGIRFWYMEYDSGFVYATADSNKSWGIIGKIDVNDPTLLSVVACNDLSDDPRMIVIKDSDVFVGHQDNRIYRMDTSLNELSHGPYNDSAYYGGFINAAGSGGNYLAQINSQYLNGWINDTLTSYGHDLSASHGDFLGDPNDTEAMITYGDWTYLGETYADNSNINYIEVINTGNLGVQGGTFVSKLLDITSETTGDDEITGLASDDGELLYVTHSGGNTTGIVVVDTNDPSDSDEVIVRTSATNNLATVTQSEDISIGEYASGQTYAIVARGSYGLAVLDLTDFYNPSVLKLSQGVQGPGAYKVLFDGQYVYVFEGTSRMNLTSLTVYELSIF